MGRRVVVVGAGGMAGLAVATVVRRGAGEVVVVNRTPERAERLAGEYAARWAPMSALGAEVANADIVVACAGASGVLISREAAAAAPGPLAMVDLALPHDIDPSVVDLPGVTLVTLADLAERPPASPRPAPRSRPSAPSSPTRSRRSCRPVARPA